VEEEEGVSRVVVWDEPGWPAGLEAINANATAPITRVDRAAAAACLPVELLPGLPLRRRQECQIFATIEG